MTILSNNAHDILDAQLTTSTSTTNVLATDTRAYMHDLAGQRFKANPSKCYQRHIRELYAELENREPIPSLDGAIVERITNAEAADIILKYEWLRQMGPGTRAAYGLKLNGELLGVECFGPGAYPEPRMICIPNWKQGLDKAERRRLIEVEKHERAYIDKTVCLMRGACVPWAPEHAASYLIRYACHQAYLDFDWQIFFAYSDEAAGEIGKVYQAANWFYLGKNVGRSGKGHEDFIKDGERITTYELSGDGGDKLLTRFGWTPEQGKKRTWLRNHGYTPDFSKNTNKGKWVWFEGRDKRRLKDCCRYEFKPYPQRAI